MTCFAAAAAVCRVVDAVTPRRECRRLLAWRGASPDSQNISDVSMNIFQFLTRGRNRWHDTSSVQGKIFSFVQQKLYIKVCVLKFDVKVGGFEPKRKLSGKLHQNFSEQHFEDCNKQASLRRNTAAMVVRLLVMLSTRPWTPHTREMKWVPGPSAATTPPPPRKPMDRQKGDYPGLVTSACLSCLPPLLLTSLNETNPAPAWRLETSRHAAHWRC